MLPTVVNGKPRKRQRDALVEFFKAAIDAKRSEPITHKEIAGVIGEMHGSNGYRTVVSDAIRNTHKQTGMWLDSLHGVGYEVPSGDRQIKSAVGVIRSAKRRMNRGADRIRSVSNERLDDHGMKTRVFMVSTMNRLRDAMEPTVKELSLTLGRRDGLPAAK